MDEARKREQERHEAERAARTDAEAQEPTEPQRELPTREELQATVREMRQRRFELFNNCEPMGLSVNSQFIKDRIQTMAESRLRAARLFAFEVTPTTSSMVVFVGRSQIKDTDGTQIGVMAVANVSYRKLVEDAWGNARPAETWSSFIYNGYGGTEEAITGGIMQNMSEMIDGFLLEYLRVNEAAC